MIRVRQDRRLGPHDDEAVTVTMTRENAKQLFHALNYLRDLALEVGADGPVTDDHPGQQAVDSTGQLAFALQTELGLEPPK